SERAVTGQSPCPWSNQCSERAPSATSFFKQELAHFSNDQPFVYDEHVVVGVMQFDDSSVLHLSTEALDSAIHPLRERLDASIEFLLLGRLQVPVIRRSEFG